MNLKKGKDWVFMQLEIDTPPKIGYAIDRLRSAGLNSPFTPPWLPTGAVFLFAQILFSNSLENAVKSKEALTSTQFEIKA